MLELLKEIILDFHESSLNTGITRHLQYDTVPRKALICIGVRRCGKSTLLLQMIQKLLDQGISIENIIYLNFFDDRLAELRNGHFSLINEAYYSLYPEKRKQEKVYYFFDELQEIPYWEKFVDRLLRVEDCEVAITGSSAKLLSTEIATEMRGRSLSWELFPFAFTEFLDYHQVDYRRLTSKTKAFLQHHFTEYFEKGGFPEVISLDKRLRLMTHQEYFKAILHRDIIARFDSNHPKAVIELGHRLANNVASLHSINRLTETLRSIGYKVSKSFVSECLDWFQDAYLFFSVKIYSPSLTKQNANPRKIYAIDHALIPSVASKILINSGLFLENLVFLHLRRKTEAIYYLKTRSGKEVDFLWIDEKKEKNLTQVSWDITDETTKKREISALWEAMEELQLTTASIVTQNQRETLNNNYKTIEVIPAWQFCLS